MLAAVGRAIAFTDADLSYPPEQLVGMTEAIEEGWDVVVGNRHHRDTRTQVRAGVVRVVGSTVFNASTRLVLRAGYRDTQSGINVFDGHSARRIFAMTRLDGFAFDVEVLLIAERLGLRVTEMPVEVINASSSTVSVARDALRMMRDLNRLRRWAAAGAYDPAPVPASNAGSVGQPAGGDHEVAGGPMTGTDGRRIRLR
jgi:dolichyl-phosphate beta-glucosyltransferase